MKKLIYIISIVSSLTSCYNDKSDKLYPIPVTTNTVTPTCDTTSVSFSTTILPILSQNCNISGCHDGSNKSVINFSTYAKVNDNASSIVSYISPGASDRMPKGLAPLSTCNINKISAWVNQGAQNN